MNKRKLQVVCALMLSSTILLSGCSKESSQTGKEHEELKKENTTLAKENSKLEGKYEELEEQVEVLKQELDGLNSMLENKEADNTQDDTNDEKETMSIYSYTKDQETGEIQEGIKTTMRSDATLEEKLNLLATHVSKQHFNGLAMELESLENKHAVIRLKETTEAYEDSWIKNYFLDETKSELSSACLVESFLQRKYDGDWIESVEFVYEGDAGWKNGYIQNLEQIYDR